LRDRYNFGIYIGLHMVTKVIVIGGGEKAISVIKRLSSTPNMQVVAICDVADDSIAMTYARGAGIDTSIDLYSTMVSKRADMLIETSGSKDRRCPCGGVVFG
jgi:FlaA1/EpsC-like NDP-sugar epimerase